MIAQRGSYVLENDGWDVRVLEFHSMEAAREWTRGCGLVKVSMKKFIFDFGSLIPKRWKGVFGV